MNTTTTTTLSSSECSSGCESGWTMYLDQSSNSADQFRHQKSANLEDYCYYKREDGHEDEDLSMVSDASSGPPHFQEDHQGEFYNPGTGYFCNPSSSYAASAFEQPNRTITKKTAKQHRPKQQQQQHHCSYNLDDTATSSPYQQYMGLPQFEASREQALGLSDNHFKGQSSLKKHFGFFKSSASRKSGDAGGRR